MKHVSPFEPDSCAAACAETSSVEALNRECYCLSVDPEILRGQVDAVLADLGVSTSLIESHPHLFSALPVYVSRHHLEQIAQVVAAIHDVAGTAEYQTMALSWAPKIAAFDPGSPGGLLGLDFHLGPDGPRLIEINTNPGGVLLNGLLARAQRKCMPQLTVPPTDATKVEDKILEVMLTEWRLQTEDACLGLVVIVDDAPEQQYLYPEFVLFRELFRQRGYAAEICAPTDLEHRDHRLWLNGSSVDFVYNRLTDFSLEHPANEAIRSAYLAGDVVVSPHPRAHAIYADKRNLSLLCDSEFLHMTGIPEASINLLLTSVPKTELVTPENRDLLWKSRRRLFFKPAAGYGSKASYRGDKLTRRVWEDIGRGVYVAQDLVRPSERNIAILTPPLKVDLRCYAYCGDVLLYAARIYEGQTTNFRTPGGGFASVLTAREL
jgi:hypothetical protein